MFRVRGSGVLEDWEVEQDQPDYDGHGKVCPKISPNVEHEAHSARGLQGVTARAAEERFSEHMLRSAVGSALATMKKVRELETIVMDGAARLTFSRVAVPERVALGTLSGGSQVGRIGQSPQSKSRHLSEWQSVGYKANEEPFHAARERY